MLRLNTFNCKKQKGMNKYLKLKVSPIYFNNIIFDYILIKEHAVYNIIKDVALGIYVCCFNNIIIIHLDEKYFKDFKYLYNNSKKYTFDIYTNIYNGNKMYHIFCTSNNLKDLYNQTYFSFLNTNDSNYKYNCLTILYGSCLIINKRFSDKNTDSKYEFIKSIGSGCVNVIIKTQIATIIKIINNYIDFLPCHYLL
jgi:hypothetical protein